jgi:hypothetical protein
MILSRQDFDKDSGKEWSDLCDLAKVHNHEEGE